MTDIINVHNIGPVLAKELNNIDIYSYQDFLDRGWQESYLDLIEVYPNRINLNCIYAFYGAELAVDWRLLTDEQKHFCRVYLEQIKNDS